VESALPLADEDDWVLISIGFLLAQNPSGDHTFG